MVRYRTEDGKGWYHEPPYTEAEEMELYRRMDGVVSTFKSGHRTLPDQPSLPRKSQPPQPEE